MHGLRQAIPLTLVPLRSAFAMQFTVLILSKVVQSPSNRRRQSVRPNPSVNRTLHGMPASGPPFHSGPCAVMPFRAGYLKR